MSNAVFTTKVNPVYDDLPEVRYHFPKTYLNYAQKAVGDWIIYYEPRREGKELSGRAGRQCYFAMAHLDRIEPDNEHLGYFYAFVSGYLEFVNPIPFRKGSTYFESLLRKADGTTNKGQFGRAIRLLPKEEFQEICRLGFAGSDVQFQLLEGAIVSEPINEWGRPDRFVFSKRPFRDEAFARVISSAYEATCAMTGMRIVSADGYTEIEAAHIRPVAHNGPDSPRNGIALSRTMHWMFDKGLLSLADDGTILTAQNRIPEKALRLLNANGKAMLPAAEAWRPHSSFLRHHREVVFKG